MQTKHIFLLLILMLSMSNCSKNDDTKIASMQAKVDGELIVCDSRVTTIRDLNGGVFGIEGYTEEDIGFTLKFPISQGVGTYQFLSFSGSFQNEGWFKTGDVNIQYKSIDGSVIVTEASGNRFKGTFSFTAEHNGDSKIISEGVFEIDN